MNSHSLRAEWRKIRSLPFPRWLALAFLVSTAGAAAAALASASGTAQTAAETAQMGLIVAGTIATIVFAVWMFGVEVSQGTLGRTLLAEPRRGAVLRAKGLLACLLPLIMTVIGAAVTLPLLIAAINRHGGHADVLELVTDLAGTVAQVSLTAPISFGLALLTRSMAGGTTASLALLGLMPGIFVACGIAEASPSIALQALHDHIAGADAGFPLTQQTDIAPATIVAVLLAWSLVLLLVGTSRLTRRDIA
jgi:ABC-2 type transport system permease protein